MPHVTHPLTPPYVFILYIQIYIFHLYFFPLTLPPIIIDRLTMTLQITQQFYPEFAPSKCCNYSAIPVPAPQNKLHTGSTKTSYIMILYLKHLCVFQPVELVSDEVCPGRQSGHQEWPLPRLYVTETTGSLLALC